MRPRFPFLMLCGLVLWGLLWGSAHTQAQTPVLTTSAATAVTDLAAVLNGTLNANGGGFFAQFAYGPTTDYGASQFATPSYVTGSSPVAVTCSPADLLPGTTYHFRISTYVAAVGGYVSGADQTFTTSAAATPPTITGAASTTALGATAATLRAPTVTSGSSPTTLMFEYGTTTGYGTQVSYAATLATNTTVTSASVPLTGLTPGTTYHFRTRATNAQGTASSPDATFTTPSLPVVVTNAASGVTDLNAVLHGTANASGGQLNVYFQFGPTSGYGSTVQAQTYYVSGSSTVALSASPSGLLPSTTYHYRLWSMDDAGTLYPGADRTFTTATAATPPVLGALTASGVTSGGATLRVSPVAAGSSPATVVYGYGPTTAYGAEYSYDSTLAPGTTAYSTEVRVTGLTPATTYHFRARGSNAQGTVFSPDSVFTTLAPPVVTTGAAAGVTDIAAVLNGTANPNGGPLNVSFQYGLTISYGSTASPQDGYLTGSTLVAVSKALTGLLPGTTYHYRLQGYDSAYVPFYGADHTFTTGPAATPPTVGTPTSDSVTASTAGLGSGSVAAGSSETSVIFEYGTTTAYGSQWVVTATIPASTTGYPSAQLTGLPPSTTYHFRVKATNAQGTTYGANATFTTLAVPVVTSTAASGVTDIAAVLHGTAEAGGGRLNLSFQFGTTTGYGSYASALPSSVTGSELTAVSAVPTGLVPNTTYHFRLRGTDQAAVIYLGEDQTFTTGPPATPPVVGPLSTQSISATTTTLRASSIAAGSSATTVLFEYGPTTAYGTQVAYGSTLAANTTAYSPSVTLTGLTPATTFHFRIRATNAQGTTASSDAVWTTLAAPSVTTEATTGVSDIAAVFHGTAQAGGGRLIVNFQYGTTTSYGSTAYPQDTEVDGTNATAVAASPAGLQPGTTYHYRLRGQDGGSVYYYGEDRTFTTGPAATPPMLGAVSSTVSPTTARVEVSNFLAGSSAATLVYEYGPTAAYGSEFAYPTILSANTQAYSTYVTLTGLTPGTTYHFRAKATNAQGTTVTPDAVFTTLAAPVVGTGAATGVTDLAAVLAGTANASGGSLSVDFQIGTSTSYGASIAAQPSSYVSGSNPVARTGNATGLLPGTTYHYRLRGADNASVYWYGADQTFTTGAAATPPTVGTPSSELISASTGRIWAGMVTAGSSAATVIFEYGPTTAYGSEIVASAGALAANATGYPYAQLTGLSPSTTYHFRARAVNGQGTAYGANATFTTRATPVLTTGTATNVTDTNAVLNGTAHAGGGNVTAYFELGTTTSYGTNLYPSGSSVSGNSTVALSLNAITLNPSTTYHYRMRGADSSGVVFFGTDTTFTTAPAATPPVVGTVSISSLTSTTVLLQLSSVAAGSSPANVIFEYGRTTAYGSEIPYTLTFPTNTTTNNVTVGLIGLASESTWYFRAKATNAQGVVFSPNATFTTLATPLVTTGAASGVTDIAAILAGTANPNGGSLQVSFDYGTTTSYGNTAYPSNSTVSGTTPVAVTATPAGLLPGTTYHYRLKGRDGASIYYYGSDATFTTGAAATPPSLGTPTASSLKTTSATLYAYEISTGSSAVVLAFEYGLNTAYGSVATLASPIPASTVYGSQSLAVTGLSPGTVYHFRARATNGEGTAYSPNATFTTPALPIVNTVAASSVTDLTATLNGSANANLGSYTASFEYGLTPAYGATLTASSISGSTLTTRAAAVPGLLPATTYHYRFKLTDGVTSYYGADATFTTAAPATPPTATTAAASGVTATTAVLKATTVRSGSSPAMVRFEYGTTTAYGTTVPYLTQATNYLYSSISLALTGLQPTTTYHYRVVTTNAQGTVTGANMSFTTLGLPTVTTGAATSVTDYSATLNATINPAGLSATVTFEYGPTTAYGSTVSATTVSGTAPLARTASPPKLLPATTYYFRVRIDNADGAYYGADATFTTAPATSLPIATSLAVSSIGVTAATASVTVLSRSSPAAVVFEYGPTTAYGFELPYATVVPINSTLTVSVKLPGLLPGTPYHFRARATNGQGTQFSEDLVFYTLGPPVVTTGAATGVSDIAASLNGAVTGPGGSFYVSFEYGKTATYGSTVTPTPSSVTGLNQIAPAASLSGLSPATVYHFRLRGYDAADTYFYGQDMTFTTAPATTQPTVATGTPALITAMSASFAAAVYAGAAPVTLVWEYGVSTAYGSELAYSSTLSIGSNSTSLSRTVSTLLPETTYHYRARISSTQGTFYGEDVTFTTASIAQGATTLPASLVSPTSATLNGSIANNAGTSTLSFEWGLDETYGQTVNATPATATASSFSRTITAALTGVAAGTTYHFRAVNANANGPTYGADLTFTTPPEPVIPGPFVVTGTAFATSSGTAIFRGTVNARGLPTTALVEYGQFTTYSFAASTAPFAVSGTADTAVSATVTGLTANTLYHYRIVATNSLGTTSGSDATVQIVQGPAVTASAPTPVSSQSATLVSSFSSSTSATAYFEFGPTTAYGTTLPIYSSFSGTARALVGGTDFYNYGLVTPLLTPGTTYHYRLVVTNAGGTAFGSDVAFTTDFASATVTLQAVTGLTATAATLNVSVTETGGTDALSFDYGPTSAYGFNSAATPATASGTGTTASSLSLAGLTPGTTYHYRFKTRRTQVGTISSTSFADRTFTTLTLLESWRQQHFSSTANSGLSADSATPDGDGIPNLLKYALGLAPGIPTAALPQSTFEEYNGLTFLSFIFPRDPLKTDLTYAVQVADRPSGPWTTIAASISGAATAGPGFVAEAPGANGMIAVEVRDTVSVGAAPGRFLRLQVTH